MACPPGPTSTRAAGRSRRQPTATASTDALPRSTPDPRTPNIRSSYHRVGNDDRGAIAVPRSQLSHRRGARRRPGVDPCVTRPAGARDYRGVIWVLTSAPAEHLRGRPEVRHRSPPMERGKTNKDRGLRTPGTEQRGLGTGTGDWDWGLGTGDSAGKLLAPRRVPRVEEAWVAESPVPSPSTYSPMALMITRLDRWPSHSP